MPSFAFGLQTFLTGSDGTRFRAPQPLKSSLRRLRKANRTLSRKQRGSGRRWKARQALARVHATIANQRQAWHWQLAHELRASYDTIYLEDLNLRGMITLWGRKVADLGFGQFVQILHATAQKTGVEVHHIDRFFPSTKLCHVCGALNACITLRDRVWSCPCGENHPRDQNAARNIFREGASSHVQGGCKTCMQAATV